MLVACYDHEPRLYFIPRRPEKALGCRKQASLPSDNSEDFIGISVMKSMGAIRTTFTIQLLTARYATAIKIC